MHEMSLVQGLLSQLHELAREHNKTKVITVCMDIGPLSGVVIDSFQFGFDILSAEDPLTRSASLVIESTPATYLCCGCGKRIEEELKPEACPACSETLLSPEGGDDIILRQVQME
ncbi:MAG: hydrogenase maturation nickel metallochaperone HypA [Proteobacteria bacterium]|nr:hydrogenase maturation nickel metallochaperone HypA [Pseudomonadota bacterium]MBU1137962.1 hydrogenase maturation nickel metallochaperone HypA [Pseudomonadota bacterium]MBU1232626.1 hydrogenase maturation nickel metallochaperone HypA [Pseudomonadota bacterium]MBU1420303.1 hydrogenase maturation nickel metallochaperone HypA [Pseudomonadota bacterium]MBU1455632.1 hydrogenase maturation nickel metallochaperone HypA [Pseudomonadota bacterium]